MLVTPNRPCSWLLLFKSCIFLILGKELTTLKVRLLLHVWLFPTRKVKGCISHPEPNDEIIMRIEGKQGVEWLALSLFTSSPPPLDPLFPLFS